MKTLIICLLFLSEFLILSIMCGFLWYTGQDNQGLPISHEGLLMRIINVMIYVVGIGTGIIMLIYIGSIIEKKLR